MSALFTAGEILDATRGRVVTGDIGSLPGRLVWNLDDIAPDDWFVAMSSGVEDSHDSLDIAFESGAQGCIVNDRQRYCFSPPNRTLISVADTELAILELARSWRLRAAARVVTVTGSVGRKNTISFLEFLMRKKYRCHIAIEQEALGCLPDVLSMPSGTELLIAEVSGTKRGDIARVGSYLKPDLAVITNTHHPIPSRVRDRRVAALNCEILEAVSDDNSGMAVVYDRNPAVQERSRPLLKGLRSVCFSEDRLSLSKSGVIWLTENSDISQVESQVDANAWCAVTAAVCLGFSLEENQHIVLEVVVNAG